MNSIGNSLITSHLEAVRKAARLTQAELAARLGVTPQMVSYLETADADIRFSVLAGWAAALGLEPALVPARRRILLVDDEGAVLGFRGLTKHALVTGPDRFRACLALLEIRPGIRRHYGRTTGTWVSDDAVALELLDADTLFAEEVLQGTLVVDLDELASGQLSQVEGILSRARMNGWSVILVSEDHAISRVLQQNVGEHLHAADGEVSARKNDELLPLGRIVDVLGMVAPKVAPAHGVLLGVDTAGLPVFLAPDDLSLHGVILGQDRDRTVAVHTVVAGLLDLGWDATVVDFDAGVGDAALGEWFETYAKHNDVRHNALTLRGWDSSAKLDVLSGLDAEAAAEVLMAAQEFESPYYRAVGKQLALQAVRLIQEGHAADPTHHPAPSPASVGALLSAPDLPVAAEVLLRSALAAGAPLSEDDVRSLIRPARVSVESAAAVGARISFLAGTRVARNVLTNTEGSLNLAARGVTYLGLDAWGHPELSDLIFESVVRRTTCVPNSKGARGSLRRALVVVGAESARQETIIELLGRAHAASVSVILVSAASSVEGRQAQRGRCLSPEDFAARLQNVNVVLTCGHTQSLCAETLKLSGLGRLLTEDLSQLRDGESVLVVTKPRVVRNTVTMRDRKAHEVLR